jgi:hypothetical protein
MLVTRQKTYYPIEKPRLTLLPDLDPERKAAVRTPLRRGGIGDYVFDIKDPIRYNQTLDIKRIHSAFFVPKTKQEILNVPSPAD